MNVIRHFTQSSGLIYHKRIHSGGKAPSSAMNVIRHLYIPLVWYSIRGYTAGEKDLSSAMNVIRAFVQPSGLIQHKRIHSGERPFQCNECDKAFCTVLLV